MKVIGKVYFHNFLIIICLDSYNFSVAFLEIKLLLISDKIVTFFTMSKKTEECFSKSGRKGLIHKKEDY